MVAAAAAVVAVPIAVWVACKQFVIVVVAVVVVANYCSNSVMESPIADDTFQQNEFSFSHGLKPVKRLKLLRIREKKKPI